MLESHTQLAHKTADDIFIDNKGVTCEVWKIPSYPRYFLVRRYNIWSVYDRKKKCAITRYKKNIKSGDTIKHYYCYRLVDSNGKPSQYQQSRLVMLCLSHEDPQNFVCHRNGDSLDDKFDNLYYRRGKGYYEIRNVVLGKVYCGNKKEIRIAARMAIRTLDRLINGGEVYGYQLLKKEE